MIFPDWDIRPCGLSVRTDSLTVFVDLSRLPKPVAKAFRLTLQIPEKPLGVVLPHSDGMSLSRISQDEFNNFYNSRPDQALQFATLLSAFFHESRHIHDLRATRIGAELLLNDYRVYSGIQKIIEDLSVWQQSDSSRRIQIPLSKSIENYSSDKFFPAKSIMCSLDQAKLISNWWNRRSGLYHFPGTSIRELFETLGFVTQIEWLAKTFGESVANEVLTKALGSTPFESQYLRPAKLLINFCHTKQINIEPEQYDLITLIVASLNTSGLDESFSNGKPTQFHPGAWFDRFVEKYAYAASRSDITSENRARTAVNLALQEVNNDDPASRKNDANESIATQEKELLRYLIQDFNPDKTGESLLLATEIGIDFRDMQRIMSRGNSYFAPDEYVDLLMKGELHTVYVKLKEEDGFYGDFFTPSMIPRNHSGANRYASESSQKMRILLDGRSFNQNFFEEYTFQILTGTNSNEHGLRFQNYVKLTP